VVDNEVKLAKPHAAGELKINMCAEIKNKLVSQYHCSVKSKPDELLLFLDPGRLKYDSRTRKFKIDSGYENHPAVGVTWYGATLFASIYSASLPSEIEWEVAARGTAGRIYPWGNQLDKKKCNTNALFPTRTTRINEHLDDKSPYGCYCIAGNVSEWCADSYDKYPPVWRGGCFDHINVPCCAARHRTNYQSMIQIGLIGFRLAKTLDLKTS